MPGGFRFWARANSDCMRGEAIAVNGGYPWTHTHTHTHTTTYNAHFFELDTQPFLERILVPKTSKVSPQTPAVAKRRPEYQKGSKRAPKRLLMAQKGSKVDKNGPKTAPNYTKTAQKAITSP